MASESRAACLSGVSGTSARNAERRDLSVRDAIGVKEFVGDAHTPATGEPAGSAASLRHRVPAVKLMRDADQARCALLDAAHAGPAG